jgi:hypothetical protein
MGRDFSFEAAMIGKAQMMDVLLDVCPSFRPAWESLLADGYTDESGEPLLYIALADFARHVIAMLASGQTASFPAIFAAVERLQAEGEPYVREAATVGLLEDLMNLNLHTDTQPEQFRPFLMPLSLGAWDDLYSFWHAGDGTKGEG